MEGAGRMTAAGGCTYRVLGPVRVEGVVDPLTTMPRRLLALFVSRAGEHVDFERLADQLWLGEPPASYRAALHVHLSKLRRALAPGSATERTPIHTEPGGYRFVCDPSAIDALAFEIAVRDGRRARLDGHVEAAVAAYRRGLDLWREAAFLDELGPEWVDDRARRLDLLRDQARREWAWTALSLGGRLGPQVVAELLPLHDAGAADVESIELLVRALVATDNAARATETLAAATRVVAGPDARRLAELGAELASGSLRPARPALATGPIAVAAVRAALPVAGAVVGREPLVAALAAPEPSFPPTYVELVGPAGQGKTTVLAALAQRVDREGQHVRYGRCDARPGMLAALRQCFPDRRVLESALHAAQRSAVPAGELTGMLVEAVCEAIGDEPTTLLLDDLHLADRVERSVLTALLTAKPGERAVERLRVVGAARSATRIVADAEVLVLPALDIEAVRELAGDELMGDALFALVHGHPMMTASLVARLASRPPAERLQALTALTESGGLARLLAAPIDELPAGLREVVEVLAVAGTPLDPVAVAAATGRRVDDIELALGRLEGEGWVLHDPAGRAQLRHALIVEAVASATPASRSSAVLETLSRAGKHDDGSSHAVATMLGRAPGIARASHIPALVHAARLALDGFAWEEAARTAELIERFAVDDRDRAEALCISGAAADGIGDRVRARSHFREAARLARAAGDDRLITDAVVGQIGGWSRGKGPDDELSAQLDDALRTVTDPRHRSRLLARRVSAYLGMHPEAPAWAEEALALASAHGSPADRAHAAGAFSSAMLGRPGLERRLAVTEAAVEDAYATNAPDVIAMVLSHRFVAVAENDDLEAVGRCVAQHADLATQTRRPLHRWRALVLEAGAATMARDFAAATTAAAEAAALGERHAVSDAAATEMLHRVLIALLAGTGGALHASGVQLSAFVKDPLTLALDAHLALQGEDGDAARALVEAGCSLAATVDGGYLFGATASLLIDGASRTGVLEQASLLRSRLLDLGVQRPVVAMGVAVLGDPDAPLGREGME